MGLLTVQHLIKYLVNVLLCSSHRGPARLDIQDSWHSKITRWVNQEAEPILLPVKGLLSFAYIPTHRNYAVVNPMTKILNLAYKN